MGGRVLVARGTATAAPGRIGNRARAGRWGLTEGGAPPRLPFPRRAACARVRSEEDQLSQQYSSRGFEQPCNGKQHLSAKVDIAMFHKPEETTTMMITSIGLDLAKNVIQVHRVDEQGKAVLRKQLRRNQVATFFANLPACLVGMEACGGAYHWAWEDCAVGTYSEADSPTCT